MKEHEIFKIWGHTIQDVTLIDTVISAFELSIERIQERLIFLLDKHKLPFSLCNRDDNSMTVVPALSEYSTINRGFLYRKNGKQFYRNITLTALWEEVAYKVISLNFTTELGFDEDEIMQIKCNSRINYDDLIPPDWDDKIYSFDNSENCTPKMYIIHNKKLSVLKLNNLRSVRSQIKKLFKFNLNIKGKYFLLH